MSISQSVSGYGTSGVVTATMTFITPDDLDLLAVRQNAEVQLECIGSAIFPPLFYVTGRKNRGAIIEWTCCDIVSKADKLLEFSESDFDENEKIKVLSLLEKIHDQCGIGVNANGLHNLINKTFDKSRCEDGITARDVFEKLAEAMCGYWYAVKDKILFANFGQTVSSAYPVAYKEIDLNASRTFSKVICTDDDEVYIAGSGNAENTLICRSDFPSQECANAILSTMSGENHGYTYQSWSCDKGKADEWLYPGAYQFGDRLLICNSVSMSPSAAGLFFTASANAIDEDAVGYTTEVNRQLKRKLEFDRINGNVAITNKGIYFFENGYKQMSAEEQKKAKYDFKVEKGITEYSGAMVSKTVPKSAKWNTDKTEAVVDYGEKKYKYKVERDDDGNVTAFSKEEAKEE